MNERGEREQELRVQATVGTVRISVVEAGEVNSIGVAVGMIDCLREALDAYIERLRQLQAGGSNVKT